MDMESISSVNSNYSSTESVKVKRGFFCSCEDGI